MQERLANWQSRYAGTEAIRMSARNLNLTEELDRSIKMRVESGRYANANEVIRAALRALARDEQAFEQKMVMLRKMIGEGDASGDAEPGAFERLEACLDSLDGMKGEHRSFFE